MTPNSIKNRIRESGNVLFLILIAVALFAALSYAVTQSTRGGGGSSGEVELISSAQITQYPAGVRTSIVRMVIAGVGAADLVFDPPSDFDHFGTPTADPVLAARGVFHPQGGGATYQEPPNELIITGPGLWFYNDNFEIPNIGISGTDGAELTAFLPGLGLGVCKRINKELGINAPTGNPPAFSTDVSGNYQEIIMLDASSTVSGYSGNEISWNGTADVLISAFPGTTLNGQPFGCFQNNDGTNVYYHVLLER